MNEQPEALWLANALEHKAIHGTGSALELSAAAELRRLHEENEALKKDSERYRWVKDQGWIDCPNCVTPWKCNGPHLVGGPELDAAIDAARGEK